MRLLPNMSKKSFCAVLYWQTSQPPPQIATSFQATYDQVVHVNSVSDALSVLRALYNSRTTPFVLANCSAASNNNEESIVKLTKAIRADFQLAAVAVFATSEEIDDLFLSELIASGITGFFPQPIQDLTIKTLWTMATVKQRAPTLLENRTRSTPMLGSDGRSPSWVSERMSEGKGRSNSLTDKAPDGDLLQHATFGPIDKSMLNLFSHYAVPMIQVSQTFPHIDFKEKNIRRAVSSWDFHCLKLSDDELMSSIFHIFDNLKLFTLFRIPQDPFKRFLLAVRANYLNNPYHNFRHGVDVLQSFQFLLCRASLTAHLQPLELLGLAVAALCHDLAHPGLNNFFQINARTPLALLYNNKSVLENLHSTLTFTLLMRPDLNFLTFLSSSEFSDFRHTVISAILSTDMALHFDFVKSVKEKAKQGFTMSTKEEVSLMASSLIKAADISNVARPFPVAKAWAVVLLQEFTSQSQLESRLGYPVLPYGRDGVNLAKAQEEFIKFVALPFFTELEKFSSSFNTITSHIHSNYELWTAYGSGKDVDTLLKAMDEKRAPLVILTDISEDDEETESILSDGGESEINSPSLSVDSSSSPSHMSSSLLQSSSADSLPLKRVTFSVQVPIAKRPPLAAAAAAALGSPTPRIHSSSKRSKKFSHRRACSDATNDIYALNSLMMGWKPPMSSVTSEMHSIDGGVGLNSKETSTPLPASDQRSPWSKRLQDSDLISKRRHSMPMILTN